ncbi:MAG: JmjC domain-containing protein [Betaproteobacteria bacterium]
MRAALPGFTGVVDARALFALATRNDVESRLVRRVKARWDVREGPLPRAALARAGARDWTLLVNGVDQHVAAAARLLRRFAFVSESRLDDLMVSYAAPGGGVGPHFDSYDVFLIQARGRRRWRLARARPFDLVPGAPLKLIADFRAEVELVAEPGDLLYLPPGWGHDGVALDECVTCSVGMRAPQGDELAAAFLDYLHERGLPGAGYRDPGLAPATRPARIDPGLLAHAQRQLARIRWTRREVEDFLGRHLSLPRPHTVFASRREPPPGRLARSTVVLDPKTRMLYRGKRVFLNGESWTPGAIALRHLAALADRRHAAGGPLARAGLQRLVYDWYCAGALDLRRAEGARHE